MLLSGGLKEVLLVRCDHKLHAGNCKRVFERLRGWAAAFQLLNWSASFSLIQLLMLLMLLMLLLMLMLLRPVRAFVDDKGWFVSINKKPDLHRSLN